LETTDENVDVAINKENSEDLNDSHNISILEDNSTPQRKPSPSDAIEILSPVQEITEVLIFCKFDFCSLFTSIN